METEILEKLAGYDLSQAASVQLKSFFRGFLRMIYQNDFTMNTETDKGNIYYTQEQRMTMKNFQEQIASNSPNSV